MAAALPVLGMVASIGGTVVSAIGQMQAGKAQQAAYNYQAAMTQRKATQEEHESRQSVKKLMSQQRALYAKAGVDITAGSPLLVMAETAGEGEREAIAIRTGGQEEAELYRMYGSQAAKAGRIGAFSTLLTGLSRGATDYYSMKKAK